MFSDCLQSDLTTYSLTLGLELCSLTAYSPGSIAMSVAMSVAFRGMVFCEKSRLDFSSNGHSMNGDFGENVPNVLGLISRDEGSIEHF